MLSNIVLILGGTFVVIAILLSYGDYEEYRNLILTWLPFLSSMTSSMDVPTGGKLFTKDELSKFTGKGGSPVYLSILGEVYDVSSGKKHYGEGGGYGFFAGKDGTRAFVSGDFSDKGLIEDTKGLALSDFLGIEEWKGFYKKQYVYKGKLIGLYYDKEGEPTEALKDFHHQLELAKKEKMSDEDDKNRFPTCNFEYKQGQGRRIWCSNLSGGVKRDWAGLPRQYFQPGKKDPRCACVKDKGPPSGAEKGAKHNNRGDLDNPLMKLYEGCHPESFECRFRD